MQTRRETKSLLQHDWISMPMLRNYFARGRLQKMTKHQNHNDHVVERADDRNEVRHQVNREEHPDDCGQEPAYRTARHPRVRP